MAWFFALVDWRISRREFGHGDLFVTREEAERAHSPKCFGTSLILSCF